MPTPPKGGLWDTLNWSENKNPFVITIASTKDPLISFSVIGDGLRGVLNAAHQQERRPLGGNLTTAHNITLNITSNSAAGPVRGKLLRALVEYQLDELFITGNAYLRPMLSRAAITAPDTFSRTFLGNDDIRQHSKLDKLKLGGDFGLTRTLVGNDHVRLHSDLDLVKLGVSFAQTRAFTANQDVILHPTLVPLELNFSVPLVFLGNHDAIIHTSLTQADLEVDFSMTRAFMGNQDVVIHPDLCYPSTPVEGDSDGDGKVGVRDLRIVSAAFNTRPAPNSPADLNGDGIVDITDLVEVAKNFGRAAKPSGSSC